MQTYTEGQDVILRSMITSPQLPDVENTVRRVISLLKRVPVLDKGRTEDDRVNPFPESFEPKGEVLQPSYVKDLLRSSPDLFFNKLVVYIYLYCITLPLFSPWDPIFTSTVQRRGEAGGVLNFQKNLMEDPEVTLSFRLLFVKKKNKIKWVSFLSILIISGV